MTINPRNSRKPILRTYRLVCLVLIFLLFISSCQAELNNTKIGDRMPVQLLEKSSDHTKPAKTFLALGDSYTIGSGVESNESWPLQLWNALIQRDVLLDEPQIIARNGWTTQDLLQGIQQADLRNDYDLVTLLIGVNEQYRGFSIDGYRRRFADLLQKAVDLSGGQSTRVVVLSIPDWGVTPFAGGRDMAIVARQIDEFNRANQQEALKAGVHYVDVTAISRLAANQPGLLAPDHLHPSAAMYALWIEKLLPIAERIFQEEN